MYGSTWSINENESTLYQRDSNYGITIDTECTTDDKGQNFHIMKETILQLLEGKENEFVKRTIFASTQLLSLASNAASLSTIGAQDNGVLNQMHKIQLKYAGERSSAKSADIFCIDSDDVQVEGMTKDFNSIVIVGDSFKNKELMIKWVGFGIERKVVATTNIHDSSKR